MATFPECGFTYKDQRCTAVGDHRCALRGDHVVNFIQKRCVHTKGRYARKPFILDEWQEFDIVRPIFETVRWSDEYSEYVRQYRTAWIEIGRKNGKSELLAACMLYLLGYDGEFAAELFGIARDIKQAALVFNVSKLMVKLSPKLAEVFRYVESSKRIIHVPSESVYQVIASDGDGALGSNPSGVAGDEILAWRSRAMWDAMETGMGSGARRQPLMMAATTAGKDGSSFGKHMHDEMLLIASDPARDPTTFVYIRNTPKEADLSDPEVWKYANPALGTFLSMEAFAIAAGKALNDKQSENAFRQFRLNQWVSQTFRWMNMADYDDQQGGLWPEPEWQREQLAGRTAYAGLDLSARFDLTAWALWIPPEADEEGPGHMLWRFWATRRAAEELTKVTDGRFAEWAAEGWVSVADGDTIDYDQVLADIADDGAFFNIRAIDADEFSMMPIVKQVAMACGLDVDEYVATYTNTFPRMSPALGHITEQVNGHTFGHHGNPVARWNFESCEVKTSTQDPNLISLAKPKRDPKNHRIDGVATAALALACWSVWRDEPEYESAYSGGSGLMVV